MVWKKGESGNPKGRVPAPETIELRNALDKIAKEKDMSFLEHFVRRAYVSDTCAIALSKKIIADKVHVDDQGMTDAIRTFLVRAVVDNEEKN